MLRTLTQPLPEGEETSHPHPTSPSGEKRSAPGTDSIAQYSIDLAEAEFPIN